jgi:hypothetical protein
VLDLEAVHSKVNEIIHLSTSSKVTVTTPTTGNKYLKQAIESVQNQDFEDLRHWIVVDGQMIGLEQINEMLKNSLTMSIIGL